MAAAAIGLGGAWWLLFLPAGLAIGQAFTPYAEGYYLEGFGDGYAAGAELAAEPGADHAVRPRVAVAVEGLRGDDDGPADRAPRADQRAAGAASPIGDYPHALDGHQRGGPARDPLTSDGRVIPAGGPR